MLIYLLRHGIAVDRFDPTCPPDAERFLTGKGKRRTRQALCGMKRLGVMVDAILTSPYLRARETADIARKELGRRVALTVSDALKWDADPQLLRAELHQLSGAKSVLCAGHAPHLDRFIGHMLGVRPVTCLKKAGLAVMELSFVDPGDAHVLAIYPPRTLRELAR